MPTWTWWWTWPAAIDPLLSWSRYRGQLADWCGDRMGADWTAHVVEMERLLQRGDEIAQMMQVTGQEGVSIPDFTTPQAAQFLATVCLQQDAFDKVDAAVPLDRQKAGFDLVHRLGARAYAFDATDVARKHFHAPDGARAQPALRGAGRAGRNAPARRDRRGRQGRARAGPHR
jgi:vacuolar-type H+-ATPase catalytic subunit A/Vma1